MSTIQIDFKKKVRPRLIHVAGGVYQYRSSRGDETLNYSFYERPVVNGRQTVRKLASTTLAYAKKEVADKRSKHSLAKIGLAIDPYKAVQQSAPVGELIDFYMQSNCPKRNEQARAGAQLTEEKRRLDHLRKFFGNRPWDKLNLEDSREYHRHRKALVTRGKGGDRTVDIELVTLSNVLRWANRNERRTGVSRNPFAHDRIQFCQAESIRHCREVQPASGDELHSLARFLFGNPKSEVLGWQLLFEAFIGQRTHETLKLRTDATARYQPGFIEGNHLWLFDSKTHKGTFPYIEIHSALKQCLAAHKQWLENRYLFSSSRGDETLDNRSGTRWYFPGTRDPKQPVDKSSLTHALARACKAMSLAHRSSHGLRSFHVNVLRSQGKTDAEIALRIGHRSGGRLIIDVYGEILPMKLSFMPKTTDPAWTVFDPSASQKPVQLDLGI